MSEGSAADSTASSAPVPSPSYKAFISYSHALDGKLAPALQRGLHQFAKPWYRLRAMRVFRDETSLSANPALWSSIQTALADSEFFILLASPESAASKWVAQEVEYWRRHKPLLNILVVLTGGELVWDDQSHDFDRTRTTACPVSLEGAFEEEPRIIDLRWAQLAEDLSLRNALFRDCVADLAAPLYGRAKDELYGEDVRQHRRTVQLARAVVASLATLTALAVALAVFALIQRSQAISQRNRAVSRELAARAMTSLATDPEGSVTLATSAARIRTVEAESALRAALAASRFPVDLRGGRGRVTSIGYSPDSRLVATGSADGTAREWSTTSGRMVAVLSARSGAVERVAFGPDGKQIITIGADATARLWPAAARGRVAPLRTVTSAASLAVFSPDGRLLLTGSRTGSARVWSTASGEPVAILHGRPGAVRHAAFSVDGRLVVTAGSGRTARVWRVQGGTPLAVLRGHKGLVTSVSFSPQGELVLTVSDDGTARVWQAATGKRVATIGGSTDQSTDHLVASAAFSPDGRRVVTVGTCEQCGHTGNGEDVDVSEAAVWALTGGTPAPTVIPGGDIGVFVTRAAFSPDGKLVVVASTNGTTLVAEATGGRPVAFLRGHTGKVLDAVFSPDGELIATRGADGTVRLWRPLNGEAVATLHSDQGPITQASFSPDGRLIATVSGIGVTVWRTESPRDGILVSRLPKAVNDASFSPDGREIATASDDRTVRLWRLATGKQLWSRSSPGSVKTAAFSADGRLWGTQTEFCLQMKGSEAQTQAADRICVPHRRRRG